MSTTPLTARFDGKVEGPLDAAPGTVFEIAPREISIPKHTAKALRPEKPVATQEEWLAFLESVEGAWIGPDMGDPDDPLPEEPDL